MNDVLSLELSDEEFVELAYHGKTDDMPDHDCHGSPEDGCRVCQEWLDKRGMI